MKVFITLEDEDGDEYKLEELKSAKNYICMDVVLKYDNGKTKLKLELNNEHIRNSHFPLDIIVAENVSLEWNLEEKWIEVDIQSHEYVNLRLSLTDEECIETQENILLWYNTYTIVRLHNDKLEDDSK